jgi:hypothetical protein
MISRRHHALSTEDKDKSFNNKCNNSIVIPIVSSCKLLNSSNLLKSKIAPQNIMYDRRVVRGNTFAALVIPVNMQPE